MKYQRLSEEAKLQVIEEVTKSHLSIVAALRCLGVARSTYYSWLRKNTDKAAERVAVNRLTESEVDRVLKYAHELPDLPPRELAWHITDHDGFISESSVYRILKAQGLVKDAPEPPVPAGKEFTKKTSRPNELWATDFTYVFVSGWGWYYIGGVLDDFSRYLICYEVKPDMKGETASDLVARAMEITGLSGVPVEEREVKLLSDNGSGYISGVFNTFLREQGIGHIYARRNHPQTNGKFERLNRTAKDRICAVVFRSPQELREAVAEFVRWYNEIHYHERIGNMHPIDVYYGRRQEIRERRGRVKTETLERRRLENLAARETGVGDRRRQTLPRKASSAPDTGIMAEGEALGQPVTLAQGREQLTRHVQGV